MNSLVWHIVEREGVRVCNFTRKKLLVQHHWYCELLRDNSRTKSFYKDDTVMQ